MQLGEVGGQRHIVELAAVEPGVQPPERPGVGPPGIRADGGLDEAARGRRGWPDRGLFGVDPGGLMIHVHVATPPAAAPRRTGYGDDPLPDADPIPQATAPAEPQGGVVACDNSQEQEAPMIDKMCSQCNERPRRRGGIICEPCTESNLQASADGEPQRGDLQRRSTATARAGVYARIDRAFADQPKPNGCEFEVHYDPPLDLLDVDPDAQPVVVAATLHLPGGTAIRRDVAA